MIIPEKILESLVDQIPPLVYDGASYNVNFDYGTEDDCIKVITDMTKIESIKYPMIWLETPYREVGNRFISVSGMRFIIAVKSEIQPHNKIRQDVSFQERIMPVYANLLTCFKQAKSVRLVNEAGIEKIKHYGYTVSQENTTPDIWDALKIKIDLEFTNSCPKEDNIIFYT